MTNNEMKIIYQLAKFPTEAIPEMPDVFAKLKKEARIIYSKCLDSGDKDTVYFKYLSECFNVVPDLALRAQYRSEIISQNKF